MPFSIKKKWGKKKQKRPIERAFFEPLPYDNDNDCHDDDCLDISPQMGFFGDKGSSQPVYLVSPGNSLVYTKQWTIQGHTLLDTGKEGKLHISHQRFKRHDYI